MEHPLISVVTVSFNAVRDIEKTILSVINQTYQNIEYIIIDGGSTDGTVDIIKKYAGHITYWVSEPDKGIYDAMNKGIDRVTGEWINFMNAGDEFTCNSVISEIFSNKYSDNVGVIWGNANLYKDSKYYCLFKNRPFYKHVITDFIGKGICHQSMFTRVVLAKDLKFDLEYKISADFDMAYKIYEKKYDFIYVPVLVSNFDINGISSSKDYFMTCNKESCKITRSKRNPLFYLYLLYKMLRMIIKENG